MAETKRKRSAGATRPRIVDTPAKALELIREVAIFADLPDSVFGCIAEKGEQIDAAADTVLVEQGGMSDYLYILLRGQVSLTATAVDGSTAIIEILQPVDCFQLTAVLTGTPAVVSAQALDPARLFRIPAAFLRKLSHAEPSLTLAMLSSLSRHYRMLLQQVKDLKLRSAAQRLGCFILKLGAEQGFTSRVQLPFGKQLLAARLGTSPENLSRAFAILRRHGVVTSGSRVVVNDPLRLAAFAVPEEVRPNG